LLAGEMHVDKLNDMPSQYMKMVWLPLVTGVALVFLAQLDREQDQQNKDENDCRSHADHHDLFSP